MSDLTIVCALIGQVSDALKGHAGCERDVVTFVSRPLWERWCSEMGISDLEKPCIYGSQTFIVESEHFRSMSVHKSNFN